jgi:hypothetical protein
MRQGLGGAIHTEQVDPQVVMRFGEVRIDLQRALEAACGICGLIGEIQRVPQIEVHPLVVRREGHGLAKLSERVGEPALREPRRPR